MTDAQRGGFKILHVLDHSVPLHSGYSFRTLSVLREQWRRGWQTAQLTSPKHTLPFADKEEIDNTTFYRTPPMKGFGSSAPVASEIRLIQALARRIEQVAEIEQPNVLHAHSPALNGLACIWANRKLRLPLVYEVRAFWEDAAVDNGKDRYGSLRYRATRALETLVFNQCNAVTTICEGLRSDIELRGLPKEKITVIPNGVETASLPFLSRAKQSELATALRASLGMQNALVLGYLGSFYAYEGLDLLLSGLPALLEVMPNVRVVLAGGGPEERRLRDQAKFLGIEQFVRFVGRVPNDEIIRYQEIVDIFVFPRLPSRLTDTVTPLKPLEAMATGGIVLASNVGGHRDLVHHGETGFLFEPSSVSALIAAVIDTVVQRSDWQRLREQARRFIEAERTWEKCTSHYVDVYRTVLQER